MTEHDDCVGRVLRAKKAAGKPINSQAKAIAISECNGKSSKNADTGMFTPFEIKTKYIELI